MGGRPQAETSRAPTVSLGGEQNSVAVKLVLGFLALVSQEGYVFGGKSLLNHHGR